MFWMIKDLQEQNARKAEIAEMAQSELMQAMRTIDTMQRQIAALEEQVYRPSS